MSRAYHRTFFLNGPAGKLEALLWLPAADCGKLAAVICHPHPLYGGTMHNKVVYQAARTLHRLGVPVLRFNFRGAGLSQGKHDEGRGELDDVRTAIDYLAQEYPGRELLQGGFSFGAVVGLRVGCEDARVTELLGMGLPAEHSDLSFLLSCTKPKLIVQGTRDEHGSEAKVRALVEKMPPPLRAEFIAGADHFFTGRLHELEEAVRRWVKERHPEL